MNEDWDWSGQIAAAFAGIPAGTEDCGGYRSLLTPIQMIPAICGFVSHTLGGRLIVLFAADERSRCGSFVLYYVFGDYDQGRLLVLKALTDPDNDSFPSICATIPAAALYEREIHDLIGLEATGHPDLKRLVSHSNWPAGVYPLRRDFPKQHQPERADEPSSFRQVSGEGVFEVPVGPVHAGIIEPGHFRFSVAGEPVINLEAQLYYVHRGIERLCEGETLARCFYIAERISGDETFANSLAYCQAVEKVAGIEAPPRAQFDRVVFAELERLTSHLGDLAGICLDVAYGFAAYQFRMLRGWAYQIADELCGMRFLRSVNQPGGLRCDFLSGKERSITSQLQKLAKELEDTVKIIRANPLFIDRVEHTGTLSRETAADLHAVGPGGRASGIGSDVRKDFPYAAYGQLTFAVPVHHNGDVNCRMNVKIEECFQSIALMGQAIEVRPGGSCRETIGSAPAYRSAFGLVESPRGENVHWIMTGENNTLHRYKVRTPSFCNWPALCHAVKGNILPDFPLINKSFNLSYAGNDL